MAIAFLAAPMVFVASGLCMVAPGEVVVVRRLGRLVEPPWGPGLHWRYPLGIDRLDSVRGLEVRQLTIGLASASSADFEPSAGEFLTGDLNLLRIQATIHYRAANPVDYILRAEDVEPMLSRLLEAALTRALASRKVDDVLRFERQAIAHEVVREVQTSAETCRLGVSVLDVSVTDARPPLEVAADFAMAQSAESQRDRRINEAKSYGETTASTARAQAQKTLEAATAAATRRTLTAAAQAEKFAALLGEARRARELTVRRIYIDSLKSLLEKVHGKIVLPPGDSVDLTVLGTGSQPAKTP
jgi:membrane protease subunit HflK